MNNLSLPPPEVARLAQIAFGEPNKALSNKVELRFGSKGSKSINLEKCNGYDFETCEGFGLIELVIWAGLANSRLEAAQYLERKPRDFDEIKPIERPSISNGVTFQKKQNNSWKPIWGVSTDWRNTIAQSYLEARGILEALPSDFADIRFHSACPYKNTTAPCMVTLIRDWVNGEPIGIQRTPISNKARVGDRLILGGFGGGAIMLSNYHDALFEAALGVGEGLETTLSLRRLKGFEGLPLWCLVNDGNLGKFTPPPNIKSLVIAVDHDEGGIRNADKLEAVAKEKGVKITRIMNPTPKKDLNDFINKAQA